MSRHSGNQVEVLKMNFFRRQKPRLARPTIQVSQPATPQEWLELHHPLPRAIQAWILNECKQSLENVKDLSIRTPPTVKLKPKTEGEPFNPWIEWEPGETHYVTVTFADGNLGYQAFNWQGEKVEGK